MTILINTILPLFLIVLFGYLLARLKLLSSDIAGSLMQYVFYAAGPAMVFYAIMSNPLGQLLYWKFWVAYPVSVFIIIAITALIFKFILRRSNIIAMISGVVAGMANTVIIGYPVLKGFIGHFAALPMAVTVFGFAVLFIPLLIFFFEIYKAGVANENAAVKDTLKLALIGTAKNPMILASILAVILSATHVKLPFVIHHFVYLIGESIIPVALLSAGLDLASFKLQGNWADIIIISLASLIIAPLVAIGLSYAMHLSPRYAVALVILSAVPVAKTVYMISGKYRVYHQETAAVISVTTVAAVITIPLFVYISKLLWPSVF